MWLQCIYSRNSYLLDIAVYWTYCIMANRIGYLQHLTDDKFSTHPVVNNENDDLYCTRRKGAVPSIVPSSYTPNLTKGGLNY